MNKFDNEIKTILKDADAIAEDAGHSGSMNDGGARHIRELIAAFQAGLEGRLPDDFDRLLANANARELQYKQYEERQAETRRRNLIELPRKIASAKQRCSSIEAELDKAMQTKDLNRIEDLAKRLRIAQGQLNNLKNS